MLVRMLTLHTTDEFALWFAALDETEAEEVATGLELIETLGPERSPPDSRDSLLWYESSSSDDPLDGYLRAEFAAHAARVRAVLQHLMSKSVQQKIAQASAEHAAEISRAFSAIGKYARFRSSGDAAERGLVEAQRQYRRVLGLLGLAEPGDEPPDDALRELCFRASKPGSRVLYGVDVPKRRALIALGERLDRNAYGPSVRRALSLWRQFLASDSQAALEVSSR